MFTLRMETDNAAFTGCEDAEIARILEVVASQLREGRTSGRCMDFNGNSVGKWETDYESKDEGESQADDVPTAADFTEGL